MIGYILNIKKAFYLCLILLSNQVDLIAQKYSTLDFGLEKKFLSSYTLNSERYDQSDIEEFRVVINNLGPIPTSLKFYFSNGSNESMDYSYGLSLSYIFFAKNDYWLKTGLGIGRLKMGNFERGNEVGEIREDEFHETFNPFIELSFNYSRRISLFVSSGYRFIRTQTETVTGVTARYNDGSPRLIQVSLDEQIYSSGFEFGIGLDISIFSFDN